MAQCRAMTVKALRTAHGLALGRDMTGWDVDVVACTKMWLKSLWAQESDRR